VGRDEPATGASSNLVVTESLDTAAPVAGSSRPTYTVTVANSGPQGDTGVVATVTVPAELSDASVQLAGSPCPIAGGAAQCAIGSLAAGASATITIAGAIAGSIPAGTVVTVSASATGAVYESSTTDNSATASATTVSLGDLWVTGRASAATVREGDEAWFSLVVGNTGPSDATAIVLTLDAPAGLVATPTAGVFDPTTNQWTLPTLASGATQTMLFRGSAATLGRLATRGFVASSSVQDANPANDTAAASMIVQRIALLAPPASAVSASEVSASEVEAPSSASSVSGIALANTSVSSAGLAHTGADAQGTLFAALMLMLVGLVIVAARRVRSRR
jgi:hypothetical protein